MSNAMGLEMTSQLRYRHLTNLLLDPRLKLMLSCTTVVEKQRNLFK